MKEQSVRYAGLLLMWIVLSAARSLQTLYPNYFLLTLSLLNCC